MRNKITEQDIAKFKKSIRNWKWVPQPGDTPADTKMMKRVHLKDREDLRMVLHYVEQGAYRDAAQEAYFLDTIVRDQIPTKIYNIITK